MQVTSNDLFIALDKWITNDLLTKGSPLQKGITTFLVLQGKNKLKEMIEPLAFLADKEGKFIKEDLHTNMKEALKQMGNSYNIPIINYTFDQADLDKIFSYLGDNDGKSI